MEILRNKKGITLIALIITIIVLLILAGVSLSFVMNGGIFEKSQLAVNEYKDKANNESNVLSDIDETLEDKLNELRGSIIVDASEVVIEGNVSVEGMDLLAGLFTIKLEAIDGNTIMPEGFGGTEVYISNDQYGKFGCGPISFNQEGTYKYKISEVMGDIPGMIFDNSVYTVVVEVREQDEKLIAEITYYDEEMNKYIMPSFNNIYDPVDVQLNFSRGIDIKVMLEGGWYVPSDKRFEIVLKDDSNSIIDNVICNNEDIINDGAYIWFKDMTYSKPGTYTYTVSQVLPEGASGGNSIDGIIYDESVYTIVVDVIDNHDGTLSGKTTCYHGEDEVEKIEFINTIV